MFLTRIPFYCIVGLSNEWFIFFCPRDQRSGGILFLSCLSFCNSVLLSETLTLLITFEQWVLELWYFTWVFLVIRPSRGYHYFLSCDLDLGVWPTYLKLNLAYNFWTVSARALIFHMSITCDKTFSWVPLFFTLWPWPWSLIHFLKTWTLLITFEQWVLELWYFTWVFLVIRPFCEYHYFFTLWPWPGSLTYFLKTLMLLKIWNSEC